MGLFGNFFKNAAISGYLKDAQRVIPVYQSLGPAELVEAKVAAAVALAFMIEDDTRLQCNTCATACKAIFEGAPLSAEQIAELSRYNVRLMKLQRDAHSSKHSVNQLIASGIPVWITSIRATFTIELLPYARAIWTALESSDKGAFIERMLDIEQALRALPALARAVARLQFMEAPPQFVAR